MQIKPLHDRVVIKPIKKEEVTEGSIILPKSAQEQEYVGIVVARGIAAWPDIKVGAKVHYNRHAGSELKIDYETHLIMSAEHILAVIE